MHMFGASFVVAKVRFGSNQAAPSPPCEGLESAQKRQPLDHNPLDLIEAELVASAIVKLRRARRRVVRHRGGLFERAAILEIAVIPVARNLWLPSLVAMPAAAARLRIIA